MRILKLNDNKIERILPNTFRGLEQLEELYLGKNFLKFIETSTFEHLDSLIFLDLQRVNQGSRTEIDRRALRNLKI